MYWPLPNTGRLLLAMSLGRAFCYSLSGPVVLRLGFILESPKISFKDPVPQTKLNQDPRDEIISMVSLPSGF